MDSFFGIGLMELFVIAVIALIVLGPERLPGAMRSVANFIRQIREIGGEFTSQFSEEIKLIEELDPRRMINDALDPAKTPSAAKPQPAKPLAQNSAKSSTPAKPPAAQPGAATKGVVPAKPLSNQASTTTKTEQNTAKAEQNGAKEQQNTILPPDPAPQPTADQPAADTTPPAPASSSGADNAAVASSNDDSSATAEATR